MTAPHALRPARPQDAPALGGILSQWIDETPWVPRLHSREETRGFAARMIGEMEVTVGHRPRLRVLPGKPVGFLARRGHFIHALYVAPQARGRGLGARLLAEAKRAAPDLTLWTFRANTNARAFYAREGFREVEFGDGSGNDEGLPEVRLEWSAA